MHGLCMATKTISIEIDVYEKLKAAKRGPRDSFSKVIRRAKLSDEALTGQDLLNQMSKLFANLPDDGVTLDEALASLPKDQPELRTPWDEVDDGVKK